MMVKKYKTIRFPEEAKKGFTMKKKLIEEKIRYLTGKRKRVPLTNTLRFFANRSYIIDDDEILNFFYRKKNKKLRGMLI